MNESYIVNITAYRNMQKPIHISTIYKRSYYL